MHCYYVGTENLWLTLRTEMSTFFAAPSEVLNLNAVETAPNQVTLTWQGPQFPNGQITHYLINFKGFIGVSI